MLPDPYTYYIFIDICLHYLFLYLFCSKTIATDHYISNNTAEKNYTFDEIIVKDKTGSTNY
jgi:hypothetical protein